MIFMKGVLALLIGLSSVSISTAQIFINEVCPANADLNHNDGYNYAGWVELYNAGSSSVNVGGYFLSDDPAEKNKWRLPIATIPAKGYLVIWCDGENYNLHTNFSLDASGEQVIFSTSGLAQIDFVEFPQQYTNIAYGRTTDGASSWSYSVRPSPNGKNTSTAATVPLAKPIVSPASGRYSGNQMISITHPVPQVSIRYTLDGSEPTALSALYVAPLSITATNVIKTKAFSDAYLPSPTQVDTYFIGEHEFTLPVVSLSTKPLYLTDNTLGIYVIGTNGIPGNCIESPRNWNRDWDRHADFEYFEKSGAKRFDQAVDIRIGGACSRGQSQKSFAIKARDKYGKNTVDERLFNEKDIDQYGGFFLRNSGNDFNITSFRDAFMQKLAVTQMDLDYMAYQPAILYLNAQYWGIQNLREKIDADYIESNFGIDKDDVDLLETNENAIEGTKDAYVNYKNTLQTLNPTDPATFEFIDNNIDVQEYINYLVAEIYYCNTDWPGNNMKFWRQRSGNGKFRWILWDTDFGFGLYPNQSYATHATLNFATDATQTDWPNPAWSTLHIRLVLQNPVFRSRFIQTLSTAMITTFKPDRVIRVINEFQKTLEKEIPYHRQRWGGGVTGWNNEVQRLRDFAGARNEFMQQHTASFFGLSERVQLTITSSPANSGAFKLNGIVSEMPLTEGAYFKNLPLQVEAVPNAGFVFKNWKVTKRESTPVPMIAKGDIWKFMVSNAVPDVNWKMSTYLDNAWSSGEAQLGYGEGDEKTVVGYGPDGVNKFITTYFRKSFTVDDVDDLQDIAATALFDDGVVIYLNGVEVYRNNMPVGVIGSNTLATQAIPVENAFTSFTIDKDLLVPGQNTVAVEVHQNSPQSSDASFDFSMRSVVIGNETELIINLPALTDTADTDIILEAVYEPVQQATVTNVVINEMSAVKSTLKDDFNQEEDWIEFYNAGSQPVDLAGLYITDNLYFKTKHKILSGDSKTVIPPGGYRLLWADGDSSQGATHINFKLSADGEDLGLYQIVGHDTLTIDEFTFKKQPNNVSFSRIPNATGEFTFTSTITPAADNILEIITGIDEANQDVRVYPIPVDRVLLIKSPTALEDVFVYDIFGRMVKHYVNVLPDTPLGVDELPSGMYVIKIKSTKHQFVTKIIKH
jgi:hypothetical protein